MEEKVHTRSLQTQFFSKFFHSAVGWVMNAKLQLGRVGPRGIEHGPAALNRHRDESRMYVKVDIMRRLTPHPQPKLQSL